MDKEELETLLANTDAFVQQIFDCVGPLQRVDFLHQCYDFRGSVENRLKLEIFKDEARPLGELAAEEELAARKRGFYPNGSKANASDCGKDGHAHHFQPTDNWMIDRCAICGEERA